MTKKRIEELAPHEREILGSEFLKEQLIQNRLIDAIYYDRYRRFKRSVGGDEGLTEICKQLKEHGLTPEKAEQMSPEEFADFIADHDIEIKKKVK